MPKTPKTGIVLLNMGGPDCPEAVRPFLYNLFCDPDIIRLPLSFIFQKLLAWWIVTNRGEEAEHNYRLMGGGSPIFRWTQAQATALQQALKDQNIGDLPVYIAMRYWHPFTEAAVTQMKQDGIERLIVLPMYPHFSYTTTGSSLNELKRVMARYEFDIPLVLIESYYDAGPYQKALAETIETGLSSHCWSCPAEAVQLLFSAHSLPLKHIKRTKDPYPEQIRQSVQQVAEMAFPHNPWELSYQSQVGNMPWLGPSTEGVLHYFAGKHVNNVLMIPVSFVSDHVETLVEMDCQYLPLATELQIQHCHRAPALNTNETFIQALAELVTKALQPEKLLDSMAAPLTVETG